MDESCTRVRVPMCFCSSPFTSGIILCKGKVNLTYTFDQGVLQIDHVCSVWVITQHTFAYHIGLRLCLACGTSALSDKRELL